MLIKRNKSRKPPSIRSQVKKTNRILRDAEILKNLPTMDLAELAKLVCSNPSPPILGKARELIEQRTRIPWKKVIHQARNLEEEKISSNAVSAKLRERQAKHEALAQRYQSLTIDELKRLLANGTGPARAIQSVIRDKRIAQEAAKGKEPTKQKRRKRSRSRKRLVEPYSGSDYMKPNSEEFGMPEYDLE